MSRTPSRRFRPTFEHLEDRTVPAGNVNAAILGGNLYVIGDSAANNIVIGQWGDRTIAIASLDSTTTINHVAGTPLILNGFRGSAFIFMGAGDDVVSLIGLHPRGSLLVGMGSGNDTLWATAVTARRGSLLNGGDGGDILNLISSRFEGFFSISFEGAPITPVVTARNDTATVTEGGTTTINVTTNDAVSSGTLNLASIIVAQNPTNGIVTVNGDGTITYTHNGTETTNDSFSYTITDQLGNISNQATVNITVTPLNDAPIATNDTSTVAEGGTVTINVAGNDTDADSQINLGSITITQNPTNGILSVKTDGTILYTHNGSETTSDTFRYTIKDAQGATSNQATVNINVTPVNDAPIAGNDTVTVAEGGNVTISVAGNDTDAEGQLDLSSIVITSGPTNGTAKVNIDGTVTFTHNGSETTSDTFTYTIKDLQGNTSNTATVSITVTPVNDAPLANPDTASVKVGGNTTIYVAANDRAVNGTLNMGSILITKAPTHGLVSVNLDGTVTYKNYGLVPTTDTFSYTIKDNLNLLSNEAAVNITIT